VEDGNRSVRTLEVDKVYLTDSGIERAVGGMTGQSAGKSQRLGSVKMACEGGNWTKCSIEDIA